MPDETFERFKWEGDGDTLEGEGDGDTLEDAIKQLDARRRELEAMSEKLEKVAQAISKFLPQLMQAVGDDRQCEVDAETRTGVSEAMTELEEIDRLMLSIVDQAAALTTSHLRGRLESFVAIEAALRERRVGSVSEIAEMESLRLQMANERVSEMVSTLSNLQKRAANTATSITLNLK